MKHSDPSAYQTVIRRVGRFSISKIDHAQDKSKDHEDSDENAETLKEVAPATGVVPEGTSKTEKRGDAVRTKTTFSLPPAGSSSVDEDAAIKLAAATAVDELLAAYAAAAAEEEDDLESDLSGSSGGSGSEDKENNNPSNDDESLDELAFEEGELSE